MATEFRVLGPVEAWVDDAAVDLGHVRQRAVLAVLLVDANQLVSMDQLAERVWGEQRPQQVAAAIYSYLSRLRRSLASVDGADLLRRPGGYVLSVDPVTVDLHRFRRLVAAARSTGADDPVHLFDEALSLWRGEPFAGLDTAWLNRQRETVAGERLAAELDRNELALAEGRHGQLLAGMVARAESHPFDERLAGQLMLALYRCGRQAEALDRYEAVRRRLADELGADPSPPLRRLYHQILTSDPALAVPMPRIPALETGGAAPPLEPAATPSWLTVPRQLPAPPSPFTGRADQLAELGKAMSADPHGATVAVAAVVGSGGVGKSWLALHWAHENMSQFPDGQLYVNLRGFDPSGGPLPPEAAVRGFLEALGVPSATLPGHLDAQSALFRSLTVGRRMLVILDNARDSVQVGPLLPGSPSCAVVVTSRQMLTGLMTAAGARPLMLDVLSDTEAHDLLGRKLGMDRVAAEPRATAALVAHCAGLPLALGIVAARATIRADLPLEVLAEQLRSASTRLDALDAGDLAASLRSVLSCSLDALSEGARELFGLLGLVHGSDIGLAAVASLAGVPVARARALLNELLHAHLVQESPPRRFRMHDLVRLFAAEQAQQETEWARDAVHRLFDYYLRTAIAADRVLNPGRAEVGSPPARPGVAGEPIAGDAAALGWFAAELPLLISIIDHAASAGFDEYAWRIAAAWHMFLSMREHWHEMRSCQIVAVAAAGRTASAVAQGYAHRGLGVAYVGLGRYSRARAQLTRALDAANEAGDPVCRAYVHRSLGRLHALQGRFADALDHDQTSLNLWRELGNEFGQAVALNSVGSHLAHLGEEGRGVVSCEAALAAFRRLGVRVGEALAWENLGYARLRLGEHRESIECYRRAVGLFRDLGHQSHVGDSLVGLGEARQAAGDTVGALASWREALRIREDLGAPTADRVRDLIRRAALGS